MYKNVISTKNIYYLTSVLQNMFKSIKKFLAYIDLLLKLTPKYDEKIFQSDCPFSNHLHVLLY